MAMSESRQERLAESFGKAAPAILFVSLLLTVITASALLPLPGFTTEISSFAPESEGDSVEIEMNTVMTTSPKKI